MSTFQRCDFSSVSVSSQVLWQTGGKDVIKNCFPNALLLDHHHNYLLVKDGQDRNVLCSALEDFVSLLYKLLYVRTQVHTKLMCYIYTSLSDLILDIETFSMIKY